MGLYNAANPLISELVLLFVCLSVKTALVLKNLIFFFFFSGWLFGNRSVGCEGYNSTHISFFLITSHSFHQFFFLTSEVSLQLTLFLFLNQHSFRLPLYKNIFPPQKNQWARSGPWRDWLWFRTLFSSLPLSLFSSFFSQYCAPLFTECDTTPFCFNIQTQTRKLVFFSHLKQNHKRETSFFVLMYLSYNYIN